MKLKILTLFFIILLLPLPTLFGQKEIRINADISPRKIISGHLKMGNPGPSGKEILINSQYMTLGGKPIIPVMGEMHYSRYPREQWEDAILKMKANGINIIACYVFWIHHEEIEGEFDWTGNKDLREFILLCQKHGLWAYPRIGPWCHGEVRNGGTPDWILSKKYLTDRSNDPVYQHYVDRYFGEIAKQLKGLLYKEGGPVIGIQLENEYRRGQNGEDHIRWLKHTALKHGLDVPMYSVTGWGNASVPQDEVIPLWGGYPAEPWAAHIEKITENDNYSFEAPMNDNQIGNESVIKNKGYIQDYSRYPYFTCELGIGNQISEHRRPVLSSIDGLAIATVKTGSGSNLPGYYVFTGGTNPVGTYTTMEENRDETGYWNEYPDISYDFQAAIRETGELSPAYYQVKKLHYFLNEFGSQLAPMMPVKIEKQNSKTGLQYGMRVNGNSGFLFGLNYYRGFVKPTQKDVSFNIALKNENIVFPSKPIDIPDSCIFIWPVNLNLDGLLLKYATAQPLCRIDEKNRTVWLFIQNLGIGPELCFDDSIIETVASSSGKVLHKDGRYILTNLEPGIEQSINILTRNRKKQRIIILSYQESNNIWIFREHAPTLAFLTNVNLYLDGGKLHLFGSSPEMKLIPLSDTSGLNLKSEMQLTGRIGDYSQYVFHLPEKEVIPDIKKVDIFDKALWLKTSVKEVKPKNELFHKLFIKEFNLGNPSAVKSAVIYFYTDIACKIKMNENWLNQKGITETVNRLDVTGYVQKGENILMLDFPFHAGEAAMVARLIVEYFNSDKFEINSDQSWLTVEQYLIPVPGTNIGGLKSPEIVDTKSIQYTENIPDFSEWSIIVPDNYLEGLNNLYLHINYMGDKGKCYLGYRLLSDNFNNGAYWPIELKHLGNGIINNQLQVLLYPLNPDYKIYFENPPIKEDIGKTGINSIDAIPEYATDLFLE